jgi:c-di-GMP-binding flagellar brake protein YcgR
VDAEDQSPLKPEVERRRYRRVRLVTQVRCEASGCDEIRVTRDVSLDGMFFAAEFPLRADSELTLTFRLHPDEQTITCRAKVIYSHVGRGMGVQFLDLSESARQSLRRFVDEVSSILPSIS